jgi:hypothetical protein
MSSLAVGETIYKSVDAKGNVTYSSAPAAESVNTRTIAVPQGPTEEQRQEAEKIQQQIEDAADRQRQDLATVRGQRTGSVQQAEKTLAEAKADLENAQVVQDSDWQHLGGGGRHLKESYFQRVQQAEDRVRSAEQELKSLRLGPR